MNFSFALAEYIILSIGPNAWGDFFFVYSVLFHATIKMALLLGLLLRKIASGVHWFKVEESTHFKSPETKPSWQFVECFTDGKDPLIGEI